ncbi:MAG TPA: glycosyltransferase family 39 protein [Abditibacterium sp.]|jgi:predicted membrane-bound mannosyltransferase
MTQTRFRLALFLIVLLAASLRLWNLSGLPSGMHGDEAIVGYEARRILKTGSIGPYSPVSNGQPAGPIYLVAPVLALLGDQILTVRLVPAIVGTLTVVALWALLRRFAGERMALVGAFVLATLGWHIHYSRIGFPVASWPLMGIFIAWTTLLALENPAPRRWMLAGFVNGLGVYIYKAHPLFLVGSAAFAALTLLRLNLGSGLGSGFGWRRKTVLLALYGGATLVAASFLVIYALDPGHNYGGQFAVYSVFNHPTWKATSGWGEQIPFLANRYFNFWVGALNGTSIRDLADASGLVPLVSVPVFGLALLGLLSWTRREALTQFSRLIVVTMPLSNVITVDAFSRRPFAVAPFLCVLAAVGASQLVRWTRKDSVAEKFSLLAISASLLWASFTTTRQYFGAFAANSSQAWVFCDELTRAVDYMKTVSYGRPIYFYSDRWSVSYDTRKFLAPDLNALDRSEEFGAPIGGLTPLAGDLSPVWVFVGQYKGQLSDVSRRYPGGKVVEGPFSLSADGASFVAYEAPR